MFILTSIEHIIWGFSETLLSPVLSDSFGFDVKVTAYFVLAFAVLKIIGAVCYQLVTMLVLVSVVDWTVP